ncbi:sugar phosphate isomerase/epimerase family protein [Elusimicrobiota bacterium]
MKIGRNFTNTLIPEVLTSEQREKVFSGETDLFSMNAIGIMEFKKDVLFQLQAASKLGLDWLELDCDIPNPYLDFSKDQCQQIKSRAEELSIDLSTHLSYTGVGGEVSNIQEYERSLVVELHKKYIDFAQNIGAKTCVMHPGKAPFYFISPVFLQKLESALIDTLKVLIPYAAENGIKFHIENNVSFDNIYWQTRDVLRIMDKLREEGLQEVYFNFDIGHWFTRAEKNVAIPEDCLEDLHKIPPEFVYELHLNDYVPKKIIFHPPLIETPGFLKQEVLKRYFDILKNELKPEVVVLETAFKTAHQLENRWKLLEEETAYIRGFLS